MTLFIILCVSAALIAIIKLICFIREESQFDDKNIDEQCGHDWNPQPDNTKPKKSNDP